MELIENLEPRELLSASAARPGSLDVTFGSGGIVTEPALTVATQSVVVQPDGKVLVGATSDSGGKESFAVTRYNGDGSLDSSFGDAGTVTVNVDGGDDVLAGVALQTDGKIVLAGNDDTSITASGSQILLARLNSDGSLDTSFGSGGKAVAARAAASETAAAVQVAPDGTILVAGAGTDGQEGSSNSDIVIHRFNADGSADTAFAQGGELLTQAPNSSYSDAVGLAIQPDGKIVVSAAGESGIVGLDQPNVFVLRYDADGTLDGTFAANTQPIARLTNPGQVCLQPDGSIVIAGSVATKKNGSKFGLARLNADGSTDRRFGNHGITATGFGTYREPQPDAERSSDVAQAFGIAMEADGDLVVSGIVQTTSGAAALVAYRPNGRLLHRFGKNGRAIVPIASASGRPDVAVGPDALPIIAGEGTQEFFVARYTAP